jgi:hypothetical protein
MSSSLFSALFQSSCGAGIHQAVRQTSIRDGRPQFDSRQQQAIFMSSLLRPDRLWTPTSELMATGDYLIGLKRSERDSEHLSSKLLNKKCMKSKTSGVDSRYPPPPIIISKVTPRSHTRDPEYCLLSEERKDPLLILVSCTFGVPPLIHAPSPSRAAP